MPEENMPKPLRGSGDIQGETARPLTAEEIEELIRSAIRAARALKTAGFDGVELHGAHGYLLAEFVSPLFNQRQDEYGGSFEKRLTLSLRLIEGIRREAGDRFIIGYRQSGDEHVAGGLDLTTSVQVAQRLEAAGINYFHLSSGCSQALYWSFPDREGLLLPEAEAFKKALKIPVICPNVHRPDTAVKALEQGKTDVVSLSRSLLADPKWPQKVQNGQAQDINHCVFCYTCVKSMNKLGTGVRCSVNRQVGWERFLPEYFPFA
jgi:2,4-dienoyl-CoA reductase-like NADH-dependent reductase (Old Yellow Enzyme family)